MIRKPAKRRGAGRTRQVRKGAAPVANGPVRKRKNGAVARAAKIDIGVDALKHLVKPPGDYHVIARRFADEMEATGFRGTLTPRQLRILVRRGEALAQLIRPVNAATDVASHPQPCPSTRSLQAAEHAIAVTFSPLSSTA